MAKVWIRQIFASRRRWPNLLAVFLSVLGGWMAYAETAGSLDLTFDPGLGIKASYSGLPVRTIFPLSDGSFLIGGFFTNYNGVPRSAIAKVQENGAVDESFIPDSTFIGGVTEVWSISQQADGKFIVSGINGSPFHAMIVRLYSNGSIDPSFAFDYGRAAFGLGVLVRPDQRIAYLSDDNTGIGVLDANGGRLLSTADGISPFAVFDPIRISPDGDTFYANGGLRRFGGSFGSPDDSLFNGLGMTLFDLAFQSDGRVVCGGQSTRGLVARYFPNGAVDSSFKANVSGSEVVTLFSQADDRVIVGGSFISMNGLARRNLGRLNADGTIDTNFVIGTGPNAEVFAIAPVRDNKILIAGAFTAYNGVARTGLARIFLDPSSLPTIVTQPSSTNLLEEQTLRLSVAVSGTPPFKYIWKRDGEAIDGATNGVFLKRRIRREDAGSYSVEVTSANGMATSSNAVVAVSTPATGVGSVVLGFPVGTAASGSINTYLRLPDGGSLVGGRFFGFDQQYRRSLARLSADGSLADVNDYGVASPSFGTALANLADGTILAGMSASFGTFENPALLHVDGAGALLGSYFPSTVGITCIIPLADGKILVGGSTAIGGLVRGGIVRLNGDLSLDPLFDSTPLKLTDVRSIALQPDGKILVGDTRRLLRITDNGSVEADIAFSQGLSPYVRTVALQPDGKVVVGGNFVTAGGVARTNLARFNSDMTLDTDFNPPAGARGVPQSAVQSIVVGRDGKIIVGGTFSDLAGATCTNIGRLLPNGQLDSSFHPEVGFSLPSMRSAVNTMTIEDDGSLTIGGQFSSVNGIPRNSLARLLLLEPPFRVTAAPQLIEGNVAGITFTFPADTSSDFVLQSADALPGTWTDLVSVPNGATSISQPVAGGQQYYRLARKPHAP